MADDAKNQKDMTLWGIDTKTFHIVMSNGKPYIFKEGFTGVWLSEEAHKDALLLELLDTIRELLDENQELYLMLPQDSDEDNSENESNEGTIC